MAGLHTHGTDAAQAHLARLLHSDAFAGQLDRLERRIVALRERQMRRHVLIETLESWEDPELVAALVRLDARARDGRVRTREVVEELALLPSVFAELPYERVKSAYVLAHALGQVSIARQFLSAVVRHEADEIEAVAAVGNEHVDLPAGLRRAAARGTDRFMLDRLMHDKDPRIIRRLLDNPRVTERDVVKIAALRPTLPAVLETLAGHRRWSSSYRVRKALACNPYTPSTIARRLLTTLMLQDLRHLIGAGVLADDLQEEAEALLRTRTTLTAPDRAEVAATAEAFMDEVGALFDGLDA